MATQLLIENAPFTLRLEEQKSSTGESRYIVRGQFARSDRATENKRLYREHLWKREIGRLNESMKGRRAYGELDHPADGRTKLQRVSHLITNLRVEGDEVVGEAEILDTPNGRILKALYAQGAQVGVSSRGYGSTKSVRVGSDDVDEVQEDFRLDTFDFVADPATRTAYPTVFQEEREHIAQADKGLTMESLRRDYGGLLRVLAEEKDSEMARALSEAEDRAKVRLKGSFQAELRKVVESLSEEAYTKARSELESDPEVAGAKTVLENIVSLVAPFGLDEKNREAIEAKDTEIADLRKRLADRELEAQKFQRENVELSKTAKETGYRLHIERKLGDHPSKETIIRLMGDVTLFPSLDKVDERIADLQKEFDHKKPRATEDSERIDSLQKEIADLKSKLSESADSVKRAHESRDEALEKGRAALALCEQFQVQVHVERKIAGRDDAERIRTLCEGARDIEHADRLIGSAGSTVPRLGDLNDGSEEARIRARAQGTGRGQQTDLMEDTTGRRSTETRGKDTGNPLVQFVESEEFDRLSGTRPPK